MKKLEVKMDWLFTILNERENKCRKLTKEEEEAKKMYQTRDQAASRLLSGLGQFPSG